MSRTVAYVDGFNLYYRALRGTKHKWLNVVELCRASLPKTCQLSRVNYYTARISGRADPSAPARQHAYLRALETLAELRIFYGKFMVNEVWAPLVQPPDFRPICPAPTPSPVVARVLKTEEKGSDVNLGVHLVRDAFQDAFDEAAILTNDTDLVEAVRIVTTEAGKRVHLLTPVAKPAASLAQIASHTRHVAPYVGVSQLPATVTARNGKLIRKPTNW
jgi:uncharacterized LabA/DUF88 family protein